MRSILQRLRAGPRLPEQSPEARAGALDGLNLFFGALLGANLGTLGGIRLVEYVQLIVLLAGTVVTVRMMSAAGGRWPVLLMLAIYATLLTALVTVPGIAPRGLPTADLHRLVATLAIWVLISLGLELARLRRARAVSKATVE